MQLEHLATKATERIPRLVVEQRGDIEVHRPSHRSLDAVFALKLIQLVGNLKAGSRSSERVATLNGTWSSGSCTRHWKTSTFWLAAMRRTTGPPCMTATLLRRISGTTGVSFVRAFRPVQRREITEYLQEAAGYPAGGDAGDVSRNIGRLHSASVHGRLTGIMRGLTRLPKGVSGSGGDATRKVSRLSAWLWGWLLPISPMSLRVRSAQGGGGGVQARNGCYGRSS